MHGRYALSVGLPLLLARLTNCLRATPIKPSPPVPSRSRLEGSGVTPGVPPELLSEESTSSPLDRNEKL